MTDTKQFAETDTQEASEWIERPYSPSQPQTLPSSKENEFWGQDAIRHVADAKQLTDQTMDQIQRMNTHSLRIEGQDFVCTSCPFSHTVPLSIKQFTLNNTGQLVPIDKGNTQ